MSNFDRHATINGGWIAAFAIGAIMMAAPAYWEFSRQTAGIVFWGGVAILLCSVLAVILDWASEKGARKRVSGPFLVMALGIFIVCAGAAWHFWPNSDPEQTNDKIQGALPGPLAGLTNAQLRERAISFVQTMPIRLTHTPTTCRVRPVAGIKSGICRRHCITSDAE